MSVDALQHVDEIVIEVDLVQSAGLQQALDDANISGPYLGPTEQPVAPFMQSFA